MDVVCMIQSRSMLNNTLCITHALSILVLSPILYAEDLDVFSETLFILIFQYLSLSTSYKSYMLARRCDKSLYINTLIMYADTVALIQHHKVSLIVG